MEVVSVLVLVLVLVVLAKVAGTQSELKGLVDVLLRQAQEMADLKSAVSDLSRRMNSSGFVSDMYVVGKPPANMNDDVPAPVADVQPSAESANKTPVPEMTPVIDFQNYVPSASSDDEPEDAEQPLYAVPETVDEPTITEGETNVAASDIVTPEAENEPVTEMSQAAYAPTPAQVAPTADRNDLERFIGENLINKIGIAILVLGIAFFVKYAIDKDWLNEVGRVSIGILCGLILVGIGHFMRQSYRSFSSVLAGGGIAVFYFTIAFAFHQYHLIPQAAAFVGMVVITGFAVALSVLYNRLELAVIATIGGFITPFLLSTGDGNYIVLFTYLIILNAGILVLAWMRRWPLLNMLALAFTMLIYGGWLFNSLSNNKVINYPLALLFGTIFYILFLGMNMIYQISKRERFHVLDFPVLLLVSGAYFGAGMAILNHIADGQFRGLFTLAVALINLALSWYIHRRGDADRNLLFLLIGLSLTFITLTIPIQLRGHAITLFWSAEFVLLYWLGNYSGISLFRRASVIISCLSLVSLFMDWQAASQQAISHLSLLYTNVQGFVTNLVAVAAFGTYYYLIRMQGDGEFADGVTNKIAGRVAFVLFAILLYLTCIFGVNLLLRTQTSYALPNAWHTVITMVFTLVTAWQLRNRGSYATVAVIAPVAIAFLFFIVSMGNATSLRNSILHGAMPFGGMLVHWIGVVLLLAVMAQAIGTIRAHVAGFRNIINPLVLFFVAAIVLVFSIELNSICLFAFHNSYPEDIVRRQYSKAGLTIIWALCSFIIMWLGMRHRVRPLRFASLGLFLLALVKLFLFDIAGLSEGGKIGAFILLGVLLLVISFMYQKLKRIIFDDQTNEEQP